MLVLQPFTSFLFSYLVFNLVIYLEILPKLLELFLDYLVKKIRINWNHTIATFKSWRNTTTTFNIGDTLLTYIFEHFGPTSRVCIPFTFPYGLYCPSSRRPAQSSLVRRDPMPYPYRSVD